jgi:hypothetical protein
MIQKYVQNKDDEASFAFTKHKSCINKSKKKGLIVSIKPIECLIANLATDRVK